MRQSKDERRSAGLTRRSAIGGGLALAAGLGAQLGAAAARPPGPRGPGWLFGPGEADWWDSERVSCPRVLRESADRWSMYYYGRDPSFNREITLPTGRVGLARSDDGLTWRRVRGPLPGGAILGPSPDPSRFDSGHVGISDIHYRDGLYWMWYLGGRATGRRPGFPLLPGCAVSRDGIHFTRVNGPAAGGALLDVGAEGEFDAFMVGWPQVIPWPDGRWRMYYHTVAIGTGYTLAWAESDDGLRWEKRGPLLGPGPKGRFDDYGIATRHIIYRGGKYTGGVYKGGQWVMFYEGCRYTGDPIHVDRQIGVAVSADGLDWRRIDGPYDDGSVIPQATPGSGGWDYRLGCPWVVPMADESMRLYYIGSNEADRETEGELASIHQIGLATSAGSLTQFQRWQG